MYSSYLVKSVWTQSRLHRAGYQVDTKCPCCQAAEDTLNHRLFHCSVTADLRSRLLSPSTIAVLDDPSQSVPLIFGFLSTPTTQVQRPEGLGHMSYSFWSKAIAEAVPRHRLYRRLGIICGASVLAHSRVGCRQDRQFGRAHCHPHRACRGQPSRHQPSSRESGRGCSHDLLSPGRVSVHRLSGPGWSGELPSAAALPQVQLLRRCHAPAPRCAQFLSPDLLEGQGPPRSRLPSCSPPPSGSKPKGTQPQTGQPTKLDPH